MGIDQTPRKVKSTQSFPYMLQVLYKRQKRGAEEDQSFRGVDGRVGKGVRPINGEAENGEVRPLKKGEVGALSRAFFSISM